MSFSTYAGLKTALSSWLDITASDISTVVDDVIAAGESRIAREVITKDMEASLNTSTVAGVAAAPTDYKALKFAYIATSPITKIERRSAEWIYENYPDRSVTSITPGGKVFMGREGSNFIFGPYIGNGITISGVYYKNLPQIQGALNNLFLNNTDLYLFACLAETDLVIGRDPRVPIWEAKYQRILADVNMLATQEENSGSILEVRN